MGNYVLPKTRWLNKLTVKDWYPLPLSANIINWLAGAKFYTKFDIRWGYNNICIRKGDKWKAAFTRNWGLFKPLVMFFGLTNSPATFQALMNSIFADLIAKGVVAVYLDDILIYTKTIKEHRKVTRKVLCHLEKTAYTSARLSANLSGLKSSTLACSSGRTTSV
jgi:hypothetical protein